MARGREGERVVLSVKCFGFEVSGLGVGCRVYGVGWDVDDALLEEALGLVDVLALHVRVAVQPVGVEGLGISFDRFRLRVKGSKLRVEV